MLQHEACFLTMRIRNNTAERIRLDGTNPKGRVLFIIERNDGRVVPLRNDVLKKNPILIEPLQTVDHEINIGAMYEIAEPSLYSMVPRMEWNGLGFEAKKAFFEVDQGQETKYVLTGLPDKPGKFRRFSFTLLHREQKVQSFLRIDNQNLTRCFGVYDLGQFAAGYEPTMLTDRIGNIHILHRTNPDQYAYHLFGYNGARKTREIHQADSGIKLASPEPGRVELVLPSPSQGAATSATTVTVP